MNETVKILIVFNSNVFLVNNNKLNCTKKNSFLRLHFLIIFYLAIHFVCFEIYGISYAAFVDECLQITATG